MKLIHGLLLSLTQNRQLLPNEGRALPSMKSCLCSANKLDVHNSQRFSYACIRSSYRIKSVSRCMASKGSKRFIFKWIMNNFSPFETFSQGGIFLGNKMNT